MEPPDLEGGYSYETPATPGTGAAVATLADSQQQESQAPLVFSCLEEHAFGSNTEWEAAEAVLEQNFRSMPDATRQGFFRQYVAEQQQLESRLEKLVPHVWEKVDGVRTRTILEVTDAQLHKLPARVGQLSSLQALNLSGCNKLQALPHSIGQLSSLQTLDLSDCDQLQALPDSIGQLSSLQRLDLFGCRQLQQLPASVGQLSSLQALDLFGCRQLQALPDSIGQLSSLQTLKLSDNDQLQALANSIGQLSSLQTLDLSRCCELQALPDSIGQLSSLQRLDLFGCRQLQRLPASIGQLGSLQALDLSDCDQLQALPDSIGQLSSLQRLDLFGCCQLQQLPASIGQLSSLQALILYGCRQLQALPASIGQLSSLRALILYGCRQLQALPASIGQLSSLRALNLSRCDQLQALPDSIGQLSSLQTLDLSRCHQLQRLPDFISQLSSLQTLDLSGCRQLQALPDSIGQLSRLQTLDLSRCDQLQALPDSIGWVIDLKNIKIPECTGLRTMPDFSKCSFLIIELGIKDFSALEVPLDYLPPSLRKLQPDFLLRNAHKLLSQAFTATSWIAILLATAAFVGFNTVPGGNNSKGLVKVADPTFSPPSCSCISCAGLPEQCTDESTGMSTYWLQLYFIFNQLTFFMAISTALFCVIESMPHVSRPTAFGIICRVFVCALLLVLVTALGTCTFAFAGLSVYPSSRAWEVIAPIIVGSCGILVLFGHLACRVIRLAYKWRTQEVKARRHMNNMVVTASDLM